MADEDLVHKVRELGDIDLAALLCLINREHCIISTEKEYLEDLTAELQLVASRTFGLNSVVVDCTPETTLNDLVLAIQFPQPNPKSKSKPTVAPQSPPLPLPRTPSPLHVHSPDLKSGAQLGGGGGGDRSASGNGSAHTYGHVYQHQHQHGPNPNPTPRLSRNPASASTSASTQQQQQQQQPQIANIILARNLDLAPKAVQIQCLELMRTRRIFTRTAVQSCPKQFLLVAVLGGSDARLTRHLNDHFYISHWHDPEDGFGHLYEWEEEEGVDSVDMDKNRHSDGERDEDEDEDTGSISSVVHRTTRTTMSPTTRIPIPTPTPTNPSQISTADWAPQATYPNPTTSPFTPSNAFFTETAISTLSTLALQAHISIDITRYQANIAAFLRLHRAVTPGSVPPAASTHFRSLVRSLAALHGLDYATPELVQLAARRIYAHRIVIVAPERERSMQWGSDLDAVKTLLEGVRPEDVVEDVLGLVDVPL